MHLQKVNVLYSTLYSLHTYAVDSASNSLFFLPHFSDSVDPVYCTAALISSCQKEFSKNWTYFSRTLPLHFPCYFHAHLVHVQVYLRIINGMTPDVIFPKFLFFINFASVPAQNLPIFSKSLVPTAHQLKSTTRCPRKAMLFSCKDCVRVLTYLWYIFEYCLLANFDKSNCCSNPCFYFIVLWAYCSFHYCGIISSNNPTPLIQYFARQIIHPYYNTCICQLHWIFIIELFLFICIIQSACAYLNTHRRVEIVMQSADVQHIFQST